MLIPGPDVLDRLVQHRHQHLLSAGRRPDRSAPSALRVRIGHLLIAAGSSLSGERLERPARSARKPAVPKAA